MVVTEFLLIFNYTVECSLCSMPGKVRQTLYLFVLGCEDNLSAPAKFVVANHVLKIVVQGNFANLFLLQFIADICCCKFCRLSFQTNSLALRVTWLLGYVVGTGPSEQKMPKIKTGRMYSYLKFNFRVGLFSCIF